MSRLSSINNIALGLISLFLLPFVVQSCGVQKRVDRPKLYVEHHCTKMGMDNYFFTDKWGNPIDMKKKFRHAYQFSNGLACVQDPEHGKWGYVNEALELVIPYRFDMAGSFGFAVDEDYAWVKFDLDEENIFLSPVTASGPSAIINKQGEIVSKVYGFMQVGSVDTYGVTIVNDGQNPRFTAGNYSYATDGFWGAIDGKGKEVIPCKYEFMIPIFQRTLFLVREEGKWGAINYKGKRLVPSKYIAVYYQEEEGSGFSFNSFQEIDDLDVATPTQLKPFILHFVHENGSIVSY